MQDKDKKILRKTGKIFLWVILGLLFLPLFLSLLLALPAVQNLALDALTKIVSRRIDTEVSIGRVDIGFGGRIIVEDFYVEDYERDTLFFVRRCDAMLPGLGLSESGLRFSHGNLDGVKLYLRETPSGDMNIKQVVNRISNPEREKKGRFHLELRDADISNFDVIIEQQEHRNPTYGVDYGNMRMTQIGAHLEELIIDGQVIVASIEGMHFRERSGFVLDELTGRFYLTNGCIGFEDTRLRTPKSDLHIATLALVGSDWAEYKDYIENVEMDITVDEGYLSTDDIGYFAPRMLQWQTLFEEIDLDYRGRVDNFRGEVRSLRAGDHTSLRVKGAVRGIPEVRTTHFDLQIPELHTTAEEATLLAHNIAGLNLSPGLHSMLARLGKLDAAGRFDGTFSAFDAQIGVQSELGAVNGTMKMTPDEKQRGVRVVEGAVSTNNFALGRLLDKRPLVGNADLGATMRGRVTREGLDAFVRADLTDLDFNRYNYDSLRLVGRLRRNSFSGRLVADDQNLDAAIDGVVDWSDTIPHYDVSADLNRIDLAKLNFNHRDTLSELSCRVTAKVAGRSLDDMNGFVKLANARYRYNDSLVTARSVVLTGENDAKRKSLELKSDFVDATFRSPTGYRQTFDYLRGVAWRYLPLLGENPVEEAYRQRQGAPNEYSLLDLKIHNFNPVGDAISSGLQVADGSSLRLMFNPASDRLSLQVGSDYIERNNLLATNLHINASNNRDSLTLYGSADHLYVGVFKLPEFSLTGGARAGRVQLTTGFNDTTRRASARIGVEASIDDEQGPNGRRIRLHLRPSHLTEGDATWNIISTDMLIDTAEIDVGRFVMQNEDQLLLLGGVASRNQADSLHLRLVNFHIAPFMQFATSLGYSVDACTNGRATVTAALGDAMLTTDIAVDSLRANALVAPPLRLLSGWDFAQKRARAAIIDRHRRDTLLRGYYIPNERRYYARLTADSLNMALLDPILEGVVSGTRGVGVADVVLQGVGRDADLSGLIDVRDMRTTVDFTQVTYRLPQGRLRVLGNHFRGQNITILDPEGNRGTFAIDLNMEHLKNIRYTVRLRPDRMLVMNTTAEDNDLFYGRLYGTGDARIVGDKGSVRMDITARTEDNSTFFMPLSDKSNISNAEFVTFVQPDLRDTTDVVAERRRRYEQRYRKQASASSQMHLNLDMEVQPNVEVEMMVSGSPIKARGEGRLNLEVIPQTNTFEMYGDYMITEGHYNFSLQNLISKKFLIESGSLIQWTGDPVDARLDIDALYKLKTSLQPLLQGTADNLSVDRSVPVECHIHIGDRLSNPDISFAVRVPEADPETQSIIATALSTPESVDMQFLYLLVFNNFMAENNSSSSNSNLGASASAATGLEFLANQLSRLLSADDYNLVIRYRPKSEVASDEVDFGLSKSLINDRLFVEVEGNYLIDSKQAVNGSMSNFMGEAYVTYNIDRAGALKLKAFTQTIDRFDENQGLQETGLGIYYKEDFDNLPDLWRRIKERFTGKKRKAKREAEARAAREQAFRVELEENLRRKEENNENNNKQ